MLKLRTRRALALVGSAVALTIALTGCSVLDSVTGGGSGDADRDDEGNVTEEANIDVFSLKLGDCMPISDNASGEISDLDVVPCDQPHGDEVFYEFELTGDVLPTDAEVSAEVEAKCVPAFTEFVGLDYNESTLDFWHLTPTADTWVQNDRLVQCIIYKPDPENPQGQLEVTGSLKGAAI